MNKRCGAGLRRCWLIAPLDLGLCFEVEMCFGPEDTEAGEKHIRERHKDEDTVTSAWLNEREFREHTFLFIPIQTQHIHKKLVLTPVTEHTEDKK